MEANGPDKNLTQFVSCNNSNDALSAGGTPTTAGGISLRDRRRRDAHQFADVWKRDSELKVLGSEGGIKVLDWLTGKYLTVQNHNFTNTGNIMEGTNFSQNVFRDPH